MSLKLLRGQRLKVGEDWKHEGDQVEIADYQALVLIASGVAVEATSKK